MINISELKKQMEIHFGGSIESVGPRRLKNWIVNNKIKYDNLIELCYIISSGILNPKCPTCQIKTLTFRSFKEGYSKYCSVQCATKNSDYQEKRQRTNIEKYGGNAPACSNVVLDKMKHTTMKNHGVECPFQNKEILEKSQITNLNRYGVRWTSQNKDTIQKMQNVKSNNFFRRLLTSDRLQNLCIPKFNLEDYRGSNYKYEWECTTCKTLFLDSVDDGHIPRCPKCFPLNQPTSKYEKEIVSFLSDYCDHLIENDRTILDGKELDIYLPDYNLAIEFNGLYWHSEIRGIGPKYHLYKTELAKKKGISLFHIFEDEWINNRSIIESMLINKINKSPYRIYSRNCKFKPIEKNEAELFFENNHIDGFINGKHYGLYYKNNIVSAASFGKNRFKKNSNVIELLRFCSLKFHTIPGALTKLLTNYCKVNNRNSVMTYTDKRLGGGYNISALKLIKETPPSYYYIKQGKRFNRMNFQKHLIGSKLDIFDSSLIEWQNMQLNGYDRIWDCGNYVYEFIWENKNDKLHNNHTK